MTWEVKTSAFSGSPEGARGATAVSCKADLMVNRSCQTGADRHLDVWRRALYRLYAAPSNRPVTAKCDTEHAATIGHTDGQQLHCGASELRSMIGLTHRTGICMNHRLHLALLASLAAGSALLGGCSARTDVSLTGNTPAQYSHVFVTVQEVWFNADANAGPDDGGWSKFPLSTPSTVDLVAQNGGNLGGIASGLRLVAATYSQVRLIPVDPSAPLAASAQNAGAVYNFEADYVDSANNLHQLPLELLNPDKGIGIQTSLKVPFGSVGAALGGTGTATGTTTGTTTANPFGITTGTTGTTGTTNTTSSTTSAFGASSTSSTPDNSFAAALDGASALVPFSYASGSQGILWSSRAAAYDLSLSGGISGQLTLTSIANGAAGLRVSAQTLSADGSRHVIVAATTVASDGSFLLYPLATNSSTTSPLTYDVVIHGPGIASIIVKGVQVPRPASSTSGTVTSTSTPAASSATPASGSTSSTTNNANVNSVSIGTLTPRVVVSYNASIATAPGAALPAGAVVNFYQTIGSQGEVPYVIESSPIDPFNQVLFSAQTLSSSTIDSGTWSTNGTVTIVSSAPAEGAGTYLVAASAPGFSDGPLSKRTAVSPPSSGTANVVVPTLSLESGASAGSLSAVVVATPGRYDQGELLVSHDGALVAATSLDAVLTQGAGGTVKVTNLPSGVPDAVYYLTVRAWNSTAPSSVQRQWYPQVIDLRTSSSAATALTVN
jgi:Domain of unknown function (DUF4382)